MRKSKFWCSGCSRTVEGDRFDMSGQYVCHECFQRRSEAKAAGVELVEKTIHRSAVFYVQERIAKMNRRAAKIGCQPVTVHVVREFTETRKDEWTGFETQTHWAVVSLRGVAPKLDGWSLVAVVEPAPSGELLVKDVPGETCPVEYRTADFRVCDHCHTKRNRKHLVILRSDAGEHVQVGRTCVQDFLGGQSPAGILQWADWSRDVIGCLDPEDEEFRRQSRQEYTFSVEDFLTMTATVVRCFGWLSRSQAREQGRPRSATADVASWLMMPAFGMEEREAKDEFVREHKIEITDEDREVARKALGWAKAIDPNTSTDYMYNLGVVCRCERVGADHWGIAASAISSYKRMVERERQQARKVEQEKALRPVSYTHLRAHET